MKNTNFPTFILSVFFCLTAVKLQAQKLPNVQKTSIYAPATIKIDGKPNEWDNKFEAQNNATLLLYTLSNDNDNLYLTVQAKDPTVVTKLTAGGLTFTVKSPDKTLAPIAINFLVPQANGTPVSPPRRDPNVPVNLDSLNRVANARLMANLKEIHVSGVKDIADTVISTYNEYGIKEAVQYDDKRVATAEMVIPLKYIRPLIGIDGLKYNIKLNGIKMSATYISINNGTVQNGTALSSEASAVMDELMVSVPGIQGQFSATDFSGTYILAKKVN